MSNKPLTRKQLILQLLKKHDTKLSCQQICKSIIASQKLTGNVAHYLSGSISSILNKLVKDGELQYAEGTAVRGGYLYQKKWNPIVVKYSVTCDTSAEFELLANFLSNMKKLKSNGK